MKFAVGTMPRKQDYEIKVTVYEPQPEQSSRNRKAQLQKHISWAFPIRWLISLRAPRLCEKSQSLSQTQRHRKLPIFQIRR